MFRESLVMIHTGLPNEYVHSTNGRSQHTLLQPRQPINFNCQRISLDQIELAGLVHRRPVANDIPALKRNRKLPMLVIDWWVGVGFDGGKFGSGKRRTTCGLSGLWARIRDARSSAGGQAVGGGGVRRLRPARQR